MKWRQMTGEQRDFCIGCVGHYLASTRPHTAREMAKWTKTAFRKRFDAEIEITGNTVSGVIVPLLRARGWIIQQAANNSGFQCTSRPNDTPMLLDLIGNMRITKQRTASTIRNQIVTVTRTVTQIIIPEHIQSLCEAERITKQLADGNEVFDQAIGALKEASTQRYRLVPA